jgi:hypothetical protein
MPIKKQLEVLFQKNKLPTNYDFSSDGESLKDIKDGTIYQDFLKNENPNKNNNVYSFTFNTDGISLCDKSNLSIWPQYLSINEVDIETRFSPDNTIISGNSL